MTVQINMPSSPEGDHASRSLNTPEFIDRLARELHSHGDPDLPHSYYVEQVKLRLAGKDSSAVEAEVTNPNIPYASSDCFRAWAIGE